MILHSLLFVPLVAACSSHPTTGLWRVQHGDKALDAAIALGSGLGGLDEMARLNGGLDLNNIRDGDYVTVSYAEIVSTPAIWTTSSCTPVLYLREPVTGQRSILTTKLSKTYSATSSEEKRQTYDVTHATTTDITTHWISSPSTDEDSAASTMRTGEHLTATTSAKDTITTPSHTESAPTRISNDNRYTESASSTSAGPTTCPLLPDRDRENSTQNSTELKCRDIGVGGATVKEPLYKKFVDAFCEKYNDTLLHDAADSLSLLFKTPSTGLVFLLSTAWIGGCGRVTEQRIGDSCQPRMMEIFDGCAGIRMGGWNRDSCVEFSSGIHEVLDEP